MTSYTNPKGQVVLETKDGIGYKRVTKSKHFMKIFSAYGIDKSIFDQASKEVKQIWLKEKDTGRIYKSTIEDWIEHGMVKNFQGEQIFLPITKWSLTNVDTAQQKLI